MGSRFCQKCKTMLAENQFYTSNNIEKYPPDGKLHTCKKCLTMHVDNWDPETFKWILEEIDVPYIKEEWDDLLKKQIESGKSIGSLTIIGKYLSKMKLKQWNTYRWADTQAIEEENTKKKVVSMQVQGLTEEEIQEQLAFDTTPEKPKSTGQELIEDPASPIDEEDEFARDIASQLTDEDKMTLRIKWGRGYRADEWLRLEKLYDEMTKSYDIQGAGMKDTLIMICKASVKANQLIDAGDLDGFQKMTKVYNELMKSAKLTAAQNKVDSDDFVDSIGELVAICEKDKFIPRYYVDSPNDKVDRVIQDMQSYTHDLVTEELGLGNLIENSIKSLEREKESIAAAAESGQDFEAQQEEELFKEKDLLTDADFMDFLHNNEEEEESE